MKRVACILLFLALALAAPSLFAQSTQPIKFITPFTFDVGDQVLPAGEYVISVPASTGVLKIVSTDGRYSAFFNSTGIEKLDPDTHFRLVFHRYATQYYLSEIWAPEFRNGRYVIPNKTEKQNTVEPQHVVVYAQLRTPDR